MDDIEREVANDLLDDDEILFEDKKMELKSLVKQEMIKREIEQYQKQQALNIQRRVCQEEKVIETLNNKIMTREGKENVGKDKGTYDRVFSDVEEKVAITFMMFEFFYYMFDNDDEKRQQTLDAILWKKAIQRKQD